MPELRGDVRGRVEDEGQHFLIEPSLPFTCPRGEGRAPRSEVNGMLTVIGAVVGSIICIAVYIWQNTGAWDEALAKTEPAIE